MQSLVVMCMHLHLRHDGLLGGGSGKHVLDVKVPLLPVYDVPGDAPAILVGSVVHLHLTRLLYRHSTHVAGASHLELEKRQTQRLL